MNGALLLAGLLCGALGLALSCARGRGLIVPCAILLTAALASAALWQPGLLPQATVLIACSTSIVATAAAVFLPARPPRPLAAALAANAGFWCGTLAAEAASLVLLLALPLALVALPGAWIVGRGYGIGLKVASGWLIAIGLMTAALPLLTTPGYQKDHME